MFKLSIIAKDEFAVLGMLAVQTFFKNAAHLLDENEQYDAVQLLDEKLMDSFRNMETSSFGFTVAYKAKFLDIFERHLNEKILIQDDWLGDWSGKKEQSLMKLVTFLNDGFSFDEAKAKVNEEMKEVKIG